MTTVGVVMDDQDSDEETFPLPSNGVKPAEHKDRKLNAGGCGRGARYCGRLYSNRLCFIGRTEIRIDMCNGFSVVLKELAARGVSHIAQQQVDDARSTPHTAMLGPLPTQLC